MPQEIVTHPIPKQPVDSENQPEPDDPDKGDRSCMDNAKSVIKKVGKAYFNVLQNIYENTFTSQDKEVLRQEFWENINIITFEQSKQKYKKLQNLESIKGPLAEFLADAGKDSLIVERTFQPFKEMTTAFEKKMRIVEKKIGTIDETIANYQAGIMSKEYFLGILEPQVVQLEKLVVQTIKQEQEIIKGLLLSSEKAEDQIQKLDEKLREPARREKERLDWGIGWFLGAACLTGVAIASEGLAIGLGIAAGATAVMGLLPVAAGCASAAKVFGIVAVVSTAGAGVCTAGLVCNRIAAEDEREELERLKAESPEILAQLLKMKSIAIRLKEEKAKYEKKDKELQNTLVYFQKLILLIEKAEDTDTDEFKNFDDFLKDLGLQNDDDRKAQETGVQQLIE